MLGSAGLITPCRMRSDRPQCKIGENAFFAGRCFLERVKALPRTAAPPDSAPDRKAATAPEVRSPGCERLASGAPARYPTPTRSPHHRSAPPGAAKTPRSRPHPGLRGTDRGHPRYLARSLRRATTTHTCAPPPTWSLTPMSVTAPMPTDRPQTCLIQGHHPHPAVAQVRGDVLHYELSEVFRTPRPLPGRSSRAGSDPPWT